jgi:hypothetical protein
MLQRQRNRYLLLKEEKEVRYLLGAAGLLERIGLMIIEGVRKVK